MIGPVCAKIALIFSGCITTEAMRKAETEVIRENQEDALLPVQASGDPSGNRDSGKVEDLNESISGETLVKYMQELGAGVENHEFFDIEREVPLSVQKKGEKGEGKGKKKKLKAKAANVKM